jgi:cobalt-zinc-cadmium efflux system membrane fusion protein
MKNIRFTPQLLNIALVMLLGIGLPISYANAAEDHADHAHDEHGHEEKQHDEEPEHDHAAEAGDKDHSDHNAEQGSEEKHEEEEGHDHGHDHEEGPTDRTELEPAVMQSSGITVATASSSHIAHTVALTGRVTLNQNTSAVVRARFPGVVQAVYKSQGDTVTAGEVMALVESNEGLQRYPLKSPIAGTVLSRETLVGDVAGDAPLFTVADIRELWVELYVFPQDVGKVAVGQALRVSSSECDDQQETTISHVLPVTNAATQTVLARAVIRNLDNHWLPGMMIHGELVTAKKAVHVAVNNTAIQRMEGKDVVFVQEGNAYVMRPVTAGLRDSERTEIVEGLKAGERYVNEGSFIVKADIGKSSAEHEH